jgi:hypothetical protein
MYPEKQECDECVFLTVPNPKCCEKILRDPKKNVNNYRLCCGKYKTNNDC